MRRETIRVEILHKDSPNVFVHTGVLSQHEEGAYTVLVKRDEVLKFPTRYIWRLKITREGRP